MRFIILSTARSGSNLLISLIKNHPNIKIYGELFNLNSLEPNLQKDVLNDPIDYLNHKLYRRQPFWIKSVGFKIFYYHATSQQLIPNKHPDNNLIYAHKDLRQRINNYYSFIEKNFDVDVLKNRFKKIWIQLREDKDLRVLHLKRRNKLETYLSLRTAFITDRWRKVRGIRGKVDNIRKKVKIYSRSEEIPQIPQKSIFLDYKDCLESFEKTERWEAEYDLLFNDHNRLEIFYENLILDSNIELERIYNLLDISNKMSKSPYQKQRKKSLSESISNYFELKEKFKNSHWSQFFVE